jgi:plastocyanin
MRRLLIGLALAAASISMFACASEDAEDDGGTVPTVVATDVASAEVSGGEERATEIARFTFETPLEIAVGTSVTWTNTEEPHTVTARDGSFNSGSIPQGGSFTHAFDTAGTFEYFCEIHPAMEGTVIVE